MSAGDRTPRQRWGTCCPFDPECDHTFMSDDELRAWLDRPISDTFAIAIELGGDRARVNDVDPSIQIATSAGFVAVTVCAACGALTLHATHADHIARCPGHLARFAAAVKSAAGQSAPFAPGASMGTDGEPAPAATGAGTTDTKEQQP